MDLEPVIGRLLLVFCANMADSVEDDLRLMKKVLSVSWSRNRYIRK